MLAGGREGGQYVQMKQSLLKTGREEKAEDGLSTVTPHPAWKGRDRNLGYHEQVADRMRVVSGVATGQERDRQGEEGTF